MGLFDDDLELDALLEEQKDGRFEPLELNTYNVQAIFNRCLVKSYGKEATLALFASRIAGFKESSEHGVYFDKQAIIENKQTIEYLYGQLKSAYQEWSIQNRINVKDFLVSYSGRNWTSDIDTLMKLLYLGSTEEVRLIDLFDADDMATCFETAIKPTLSPKDPSFPAWWEVHKSEWETEQ